jgi:hypothetical protein
MKADQKVDGYLQNGEKAGILAWNLNHSEHKQNMHVNLKKHGTVL